MSQNIQMENGSSPSASGVPCLSRWLTDYNSQRAGADRQPSLRTRSATYWQGAEFLVPTPAQRKRMPRIDPESTRLVITTDHPVAQCVDLRATFPEFKFEWDPAYHAEDAKRRNVEAPWLTRISCRHGFIFPWGDQMLAAYCSAGAVKRRQLTSLDCVTVAQGSAGADVVVIFDVADLDQVADVMGARKKRRYSRQARAAKAEQLARARTSSKQARSAV